jgi:hypothetical protein
MNPTLAIQYVQRKGNPIEQARLNFLRNDQPAPPEIVDRFSSSQNRDGSWSPFWAANYSSIDATCFHLAQAHQLGIGMHEAVISKAVAFIAHRQKSDGTWEEEQSVAEVAPPWAKPGNLSAKLYLTANGGYWLAISQAHRERVSLAGLYLADNLDARGQLPSFLQTHWLAAGLWYNTGLVQQAELALRYLRTRLGDFSANNLTWMITALRTVDVPADQALITEALTKLMSLQQKNGQWQSDDGPAYDVHATLEALFALKLCTRGSPRGDIHETVR